MFHCTYLAWTARVRDETVTAGGISVTQSTHHVVMWEEITTITLCPLQSVGVLHLPPVRNLYWTRCGEFVVLIFKLFHYVTDFHFVWITCTDEKTYDTFSTSANLKQKYFIIKCYATFERTLAFERLLRYAPLSPPRKQHVQGGWEVSRHWEMVITSIFPKQR